VGCFEGRFFFPFFQLKTLVLLANQKPTCGSALCGGVLGGWGEAQQDTLPEREMSEDSGLESGVESARDGAGGKKHAKKNPERRRSLQVYTATLSFSGDVNIKAKALRRSKETEDIMTISTKSKQSTKKELKEMLKLEKKKKKNKRKKLQLKNNSNSNSNSSNNKKKQGGKDIDQDEEEEDSLSSSSSAACSPHRQNQPVIMRRRLMLNAEGSGVSVQCLLLVGDNVWAADSVGRITVFNAKVMIRSSHLRPLAISLSAPPACHL